MLCHNIYSIIAYENLFHLLVSVGKGQIRYISLGQTREDAADLTLASWSERVMVRIDMISSVLMKHYFIELKEKTTLFTFKKTF